VPLALGLLALLACGLAGAPPRTAAPPVRVEPRSVGSETREAALPAPDAPFELPVEAGDAELRFATAVSPAEICREPTRFRIEARVGGAWQRVFEAEEAPGSKRWHAQRLALAGLGASRLRFSTRPPQGAGCAEPPQPLWGSLLFVGAPQPEDRELPNVLLISLDTLGAAYLGHFGGPEGVSPNLDAFLAEAFSFDRAYAQYGVTRTSHTSLFTALYPLHHGAYPFAAVRPFASLVPRLAARGYETVAFTEGGFVSGAFGFQSGFDRYDDSPTPVLDPAQFSNARKVVGRVLHWLAHGGAETRFFLFVHTYEVHMPYRIRDAASRALLARLRPGDPTGMAALAQARAVLHQNDGSELLSADELDHLRALHLANIHYLDEQVGRLLRRLDELGLSERTLVVLTADHGEQFGEQGKLGHGGSLSNRVLHVPLGLRWPGVIAAGSDADPAQLVDVMPTLLELLGEPPPDGVDGISLVPRMRGEAVGERPAFAEMRSARGECVRLRLDPRCRLDRYAVQTGRFKLVRSGLPPGEALYDLREDPLEARDVAAEHPAELSRLGALLDAYRGSRAGAAPNAAAFDIDPALRERLEALGYEE
jgi:arylsulfatase A-like enzyme